MDGSVPTIGGDVSIGVAYETCCDTQHRRNDSPHEISSRTLSQKIEVMACKHSPGQEEVLPTVVRLVHKSDTNNENISGRLNLNSNASFFKHLLTLLLDKKCPNFSTAYPIKDQYRWTLVVDFEPQ